MNREQKTGGWLNGTVLALVFVVLLVVTLKSATAIDLNGCGQVVNQPGAVYTLTRDINSSEWVAYGGANVCWRVNASGMTINCDGHSIYSPTATGTSRIISVENGSINGIELENCIIYSQVEGAGPFQLISVSGTSKENYGVAIINNIIYKNTNGSLYFLYNSGSGLNITDFYIQDNAFILSEGVSSGSGLFGGASGNNIRGGVISGNNLTNLSIDNGLTIVPNDNLYYNNYFYDFSFTGLSDDSILNISPVDAFNIIGGLVQGGNFYGQSDGLGYSQICGDANADGFCDDVPYLPLGSGAADYAPLSNRVATPATCDRSVGCLFSDNFNYLNSFADHGWSVYNLNNGPLSGVVSCDGENGYLYRSFDTVTTGRFDLNFTFFGCFADSGGFSINLGDIDGDVFTYLDIRDTTNGTADIVVPGYTSGIESILGTLTNNCTSSYDVRMALYLNSQPKFYRLYLNNALVGNGYFTQQGNVPGARMNYAMIMSNVIPDYCNWLMDDISLYEITTPGSTIDTNTSGWVKEPGVWVPSGRNDTHTFGTCSGQFAFDFNAGGSGFNRDACCSSDENSNLCLLRTLGVSTVQYVWGVMLANIFLVIGLVFLVVLYFVIKNAGRT